MSKPAIAYVDEEKKEIYKFQRKFAHNFDVLPLLPDKDISILIERIFKSGAKALITDFNLAQYRKDVKHVVPYDGVKLVESIREVRHAFPCFVLTSFDTDAIQRAEDVNLIYPKEILNTKIGETSLPDKVSVQIEHYIAHLHSCSEEFNQLAEKQRNSELTESEEARFLELDTVLENSLNAKKAVASTAKESTGIKKLTKLLKSTDLLIEELRKSKEKAK
jgi:hypothetical protein